MRAPTRLIRATTGAAVRSGMRGLCASASSRPAAVAARFRPPGGRSRCSRLSRVTRLRQIGAGLPAEPDAARSRYVLPRDPLGFHARIHVEQLHTRQDQNRNADS